MFRGVFGECAGWAHSVLFAAELPQFRSLLPSDMQQQMRAFAEQQRSDKQLLKAQKAENAQKVQKAEEADQKIENDAGTEYQLSQEKVAVEKKFRTKKLPGRKPRGGDGGEVSADSPTNTRTATSTKRQQLKKQRGRSIGKAPKACTGSPAVVEITDYLTDIPQVGPRRTRMRTLYKSK